MSGRSADESRYLITAFVDGLGDQGFSQDQNVTIESEWADGQYDRLPKQAELDEYKSKLRGLRGLPAPLKTVLEQIPRSTHPMDVMRTGCSMLGTLEPEGPGHEQIAWDAGPRNPDGGPWAPAGASQGNRHSGAAATAPPLILASCA